MPLAPRLEQTPSSRPRLPRARRFAALGAVSALLTLVAILFSPAIASADAPFRLPGQITDTVGVLDADQQSDVQAAIDQLYDEHKVRLWVVYVPDFNGLGAGPWADQTAQASSLGDRDALLAVATVDREYALIAPDGLSEITSDEAESIRVDAVEPALREEDWAGGAIAAAGGLGDAMTPGEGMSVRTLLIGGGVVVVGAGGVVLYSRKKKHDRTRAGVEAARSISPEDTAALTALPLPTLDERAKEVLVETDDALRTSQEELELARGEFGEQATASFTAAFDKAKSTLAAAFTVRQRLDDAIPETPQQQREMLIDVITSCGRADRELNERVQEFDGLRDLLINAPDRLDALTRDMVALTVRIPDSTQTLATLQTEFPAAALASVAHNVTMAEERLAFAERAVADGRDAITLPPGKQGPAVSAIRGAEGALEQARTLLDAVDHAAEDIRHAIATLPAAITDVEAGIAAAAQFTEQGGDRLASARAAAETALAAARTAADTDPLGSFTQIVKADAELDAVLAEAQESRQQAERAQQRLAQDLTAAQSQVTAASDFIGTRRGAVGADARTRLTEAQRHLAGAQQLRPTDPSRALQHAQAAAGLAADALRLAQNDVSRWESRQRPGPGSGGGGGGGNATGAILGGILIDSILRGGFSGGGNWGSRGSGGGRSSGPRSFGGPSSSGRISGGGRF
ncbi:TLP18.3/Psb32/MOLO-1 phosphatase superfamily protein [Rhodococcus wratislaviensis]|uniref:Sensory rhodopsin II transducer n=1 Tax=Rhodococcus wratislaviensis TaxID=44752 RepID=A0AB38FBN6_RHOWR|nr:TPM domain-containing protein [Rhodococcus wratislaviensis]REE77006.1 TLP18.3/Psb32/MOLO-1 phosphatase superfamily protein [Rhodococcus wratislaviensis]SPZ38808.1 sensory rhodopsin II transducer [Rhodococcus wratislaviensis]